MIAVTSDTGVLQSKSDFQLWKQRTIAESEAGIVTPRLTRNPYNGYRLPSLTCPRSDCTCRYDVWEMTTYEDLKARVKLHDDACARRDTFLTAAPSGRHSAKYHIIDPETGAAACNEDLRPDDSHLVLASTVNDRGRRCKKPACEQHWPPRQLKANANRSPQLQAH